MIRIYRRFLQNSCHFHKSLTGVRIEHIVWVHTNDIFRNPQSIMGDSIVTVKQGKLRGVVEQSVLGPSYIAFRGIPFAAPPVGKLRFKDPEPPASWSGIRDTSINVGDMALQIDEVPPNNIIGDEDCLYLSVYTTSVANPKPVMFWIHGGAFTVGTGRDIYKKPDYLITKDIVLVSTNYRLGAFGFLNLGHEIANGNQALKDLIMALKWVKENIANFGGDPNNVTIFGNSAGGGLVHALTVSPCTKGLFHKAIMQSGILTCPWALNECTPKRAFRLASLLGKDSTDPKEVFEFLQSVPAKKIIAMQPHILSAEDKRGSNIAFNIITDDKSKNPVFPKPIEQLMKEAPEIPIMLGYSSHEYIMFLRDQSEAAFQHFNNTVLDVAKSLLPFTNLKDSEVPEFLERVKKWYFDGKPIDKSHVASYIDFASDVFFIIPTKVLANDLGNQGKAPVYLFQFSYIGNEPTVTDRLVKERALQGATHADEVSYLFFVNFNKKEERPASTISQKDKVIIERLTRLWTNFAKTGNPTPSVDECIGTIWKPVTRDDFQYLDIGDDLKMLKVEPTVLDCR